MLWLIGLASILIWGMTSAPADAFSEQRYVVRVLDGDTIEVAPPGQTSGTVSVIRLAGVQTNETWMCQGGTATNRLKGLIEGKWVTLVADSQSSKTQDGRWLRYVDYGTTDIGEVMISEGYALAFPQSKEPARNMQYMTAAYFAAQRGARLWNPTKCGAGPQQSLPLRVEVRWDSIGGESTPNGEWATIYNDGATSLSLNGWQFRDSAAAGIFPLPANATIQAGGTYRVYPGPGTTTSSKLYLNLGRQLFEASGDGGYLLDPDDDIRAYYVYPCSGDCSDPMQGDVQVTANYDAEGSDANNPNGEWININNVSGGTVDLNGYELKSGGQLYYFGSNSKIYSGERMRLHVGSGNDSRLKKYWGQADGALANAGDLLELVTVDLRPIAEFGWPCDPCGPAPLLKITDFQYDVPGADEPNDEWIDIKNMESEPVELRDWMVKDNSHSYDFNDQRTLAPGATLRLYIGSGTDTTDTIYWGQPDAILGGNEILTIETPYRDLVWCEAQGTWSCAPTVSPAKCNGVLATIVGTDDDNQLFGTSGDDVIVGAKGNDVIYGNGGNDLICGNSGADELYGGAGNDTIYGGNGKDLIVGGAGNDTMIGDQGIDTASFADALGPVNVNLKTDTASGRGSDTVSNIENAIGSPYDDVLNGGAAANRLEGGEGADTIRGKAGADTILGDDGPDDLRGGKGADTLKGGVGGDTFLGGGGADIIRGENGADTIFGNAGDDALYGGSGSDDIFGGSGIDTCTSGTTTNCES